MKVLILLTFAAAAMAACPNSCSGHGTCGLSSLCSCQARWVGNDCSQRQCPYGLSWIVGASKTNAPSDGHHQYAECSDRGACDRDSGECQCFEGYEGRGCRRTSCPSACSGHGFCRFNYEVNPQYKGHDTSSVRTTFSKETWDARKTRQCVCDRGYEGVDCSSRICPKGDDPLTTCNSNPGKSINDVQLIEIPAATAGWFSITFKDMFNGAYTTRPVNSASTDLKGDVKNALLELPNFAIPKVDTCSATCIALPTCVVKTAHVAASAETCSGNPNCVAHTTTWTGDTTAKTTSCNAISGCTYTAAVVGAGDSRDDAACNAVADNDLLTNTKCAAVVKAVGSGAACDYSAVATVTAAPACCSWYSTVGSTVVGVTFVDAANSGKQHTMEVSSKAVTASLAATTHDTADMQPRFSSVTADIKVDHKSDLRKKNGVVTADKLEEHVACSNRGMCDGDAGLCQCFEGFTGEACNEQTVFY